MAVCLGSVWLAAQDELRPGAGDLKNFTIPERDARGVLVWQFKGDHARMRNDGQMEVESLTLNTFKSSGVDWTLTTPACLLNKESREAVSESAVRISNRNTEITGIGFHWLAKESHFIIRSNSMVMIEGGLGKVAPAAAGGGDTAKLFTKITSDLLTFDYGTNHVAAFKGRVVAVDPKLTLWCDTMNVYFAERNHEVLRVDAFTDVHLRHEGKDGYGEKAVFTRDSGLLILSGAKAMLRDEKGNWITSRGDGIICDINKKVLRVDRPKTVLAKPVSEGTGLGKDGVVAPVKKFWGGPPGAQPAPKPSKAPSTAAASTNAAPLAGGAGKLFTDIESDLLDYDFGSTNRVAIYEGNVVVVDPQLTLRCKTLKVTFSEKGNEVEYVEAFTDVRMLSEGKEGIGDKAVYFKELGIITLSGANARLRDARGNWVQSRGKGIQYDTNLKKLFVDKPVSITVSGGGSEPGSSGGK